VLEATGLQKRYAEDGVPVRALRGVNLSVQAGEFVGVVGPSGSGKSTLLHLLAGLEPPSGGEVRLMGSSLAGRTEGELARLRRRHIGLVFQTPNLLGALTAEENVALAALVAGAPRVEARRRASDLLDMLGLSGRANRLPDVLSGGERQRLAIARALANRPSVLLADEPTGALDSVGAAEVLELLHHLHADGQTMVLVTHDPTLAAAADRTVTLRDGLIEVPV
jgi:putative ABC transport system ATP-binding protein